MPIYVGNIEIQDTQVFEEMQYQEGVDTVKQACFLAAQSLVIRQLLLNTAVKEKIVLELANKPLNEMNSEEEELLINTLIDQSVKVPEAETGVCQYYYDNNKRKFKDKALNKVIPYDQVAPHIKEYLSAQSLMNGIKEYIQVLAAKTKIKGFDFKDPEAMTVNLEALNGS